MKKWAYYNEIDPKAAAWIRQLIKAGLITDGEVDERSIEDVLPSDVRGFQRAHWFSGIAGWDHALNLAGYDRWDTVTWTGSCPCQSFSAAGKGKGLLDERHLWPAWFHLIEQCRPGIIFSEQVESAIKYGWLDLVQDDLEGIGYAVGAVVLPAACVSAPHIRSRLWFVADSNKQQWNGSRSAGTTGWAESTNGSEYGELGHSQREGLPQQRGQCGISPETSRADTGQAFERASAPTFWDACDWLPCLNGKSRPVESGISPLVAGLSKGMVRGGDTGASFDANACSEGRVGRLRGYGNSINVWLAKVFIEESHDTIQKIRETNIADWRQTPDG